MLHKINLHLVLLVAVSILLPTTFVLAHDESDLSDNFATVKNSVFVVNTSKEFSNMLKGEFSDTSPFKQFEDLPQRMPKKQTLGKGTGFLIDDEGHVVTNHHVIEQGNSFALTDAEGRIIEVDLVGADKFTDIAVLKIKNYTKENYWLPLSWSDKSTDLVGTPVFVIGHPLTLSYVLSSGHITSTDEQKTLYNSFLQTDAVVNKGNSGGPMFTYDNKVIGVVTALVSPTGYYIGYGYGTPQHTARKIVEEIIENGYVWRPVIGFSVLDINERTSDFIPAPYNTMNGIFVSELAPTGAAKAAGMKANDIIIKVNGQQMDTLAMIEIINAMKEQDTLDLVVNRDGVIIEFSIKAKNRE